ncbi:MAG: DNA polymerase IV [Ruminococcaceae bacterium]|nr:DNA polymerase IV [Oscillospiraceae bacterium]
MTERVILHCDCNSFYASVELLAHPELRDKPVAVSGSVDDRHGIILAKNDAAKKFGVQTAETVWQAKRKCPQLIMLPPHHRKYREYSLAINTYYERFTDQVEPFGIDESWLDITGSWQLFGASPLEVANKIRLGVKEQTGLTISIGLSFNKVFAKLGSDYKKPDAVTEISRDNYREIIWPLPVAAMLFVGKKSRQTLESMGINTIGDLATADENLLAQVLGKQGPQLWHYARGEDTAPVAVAGQHEPVKSVGNGMTFRRDLLGYQDVRVAVGALADEVAGRLRRKKLYATNLQVLIKNPELKSISRQRVLPYATNLAKDIADLAMDIIKDNWNYAKPIRMLTLTAQNLTDLPYAAQTSLYGEGPGINTKREKLEKSLDKIREKYGKTAVVDASLLHNDLGFETGAKIDEDD